MNFDSNADNWTINNVDLGPLLEVAPEPPLKTVKPKIPAEELHRILKIHGFGKFEVRIANFKEILEKNLRNLKKFTAEENRFQRRLEQEKGRVKIFFKKIILDKNRQKSDFLASRSPSPVPSTSKDLNNSDIYMDSMKEKKKKRLILSNRCLICKDPIESVALKSTQLPVFCSKACIKRQVQIASQVTIIL